MWQIPFEAGRRRRPAAGRLVAVVVAALQTCCSVAYGQAPADQRVNLEVNMSAQMGRTLDVNPQLGGVGYNYARPLSPLVGGNQFAAGVVGRGLSLRGVSPIADASAFRASLGSAALSAFRRDSVSVASAPLGSGPLWEPFYDASTTVPTAGFLQGLSTPATAGTGGLRLAERGLGARSDLQIGLGAHIVGLTPIQVPSVFSPPLSRPTPPGPALATTSTLFGTALPRLPLPTPPEPSWEVTPLGQPTERSLLRPLPGTQSPRLESRLDLRVATVEKHPAGSLDAILRPELYPPVGLVSPSGELLGWTGRPGVIIPEPEVAAAPAPGPIARPVVDPSVLPGFDVFTDLQLAAALLSSPQVTWFDEMQQVLREHPELADQLGQEAAGTADEFLEQMLNTPLRTLTGRGASTLNDQMLKAESLMDIGRYAEAADRYESAHMIDPYNPLPLIGKAHALLAQGNYRSAAQALLRGIELADRMPGVAGLLFSRLDLQALMGGGEIIDIRRADLMRQLEQREVPELRFLLGYLEYHSGQRERGLENLKRAAQDPRSSATIGRYPTLLGEQPAAPPASPGSPAPAEPLQPSTPEALKPSASPADARPEKTIVVPPPAE